MATVVGAHLYSLRMHLERLQGQIPHFDGEASALREGNLFKSNAATQRGLKSAAHAAFYVIDHECLEQTADLLPNPSGYIQIRPAVQSSRLIVAGPATTNIPGDI
jgi:hypothetical protein